MRNGDIEIDSCCVVPYLPLLSKAYKERQIFSFPILEHNPVVIHLAIHLENGQHVYFINANVQQKAVNPPGTAMSAFFTLCQEDTFARTLKYSEVPSYYTWYVTGKAFVRRRQGEPVDDLPGIFRENAIGRLYTVHIQCILI